MLVFANEKLMKGMDGYGVVQRDSVTGGVTNHEMEAYSKNTHNILANTTIKAGDVSSIAFVIL